MDDLEEGELGIQDNNPEQEIQQQIEEGLQSPKQEEIETSKLQNMDTSQIDPQFNDNQQGKSQLYDPEVFVTQQKQDDFIWKCFDFLFPAGKLAKLVKIRDFTQKAFPYTEILSKLKLDDGYPVVNFIGARHDFSKKKEENRGKFYAGIARACFNTDAIIVDNGVATGIEKFALKRGVKIVGIAPENQISFPKLNPTQVQNNELCNGHTHICLLQEKQIPQGEKSKLQWQDIVSFKMNICKKLAEGKLSKTQGRPRCKIINLLFLDNEDCFDEIREAIINKLPIIIIKGSRLCNRYLQQQKKSEDNNPEQIDQKAPYDDPKFTHQEFDDIMNDKDAHIYPLDSLNSEEIAQFVHFFLTYTPY